MLEYSPEFFFFLLQEMMPVKSVLMSTNISVPLRTSMDWRFSCGIWSVLFWTNLRIACLLLSAFCVFTRNWKFRSSSPGKASPEVTGDSQGGDSTVEAEASQMRTLLCEQLETSVRAIPGWLCTGHNQGENRGTCLCPVGRHLRVGPWVCLTECAPSEAFQGGTFRSTRSPLLAGGCTQQCHGRGA